MTDYDKPHIDAWRDDVSAKLDLLMEDRTMRPRRTIVMIVGSIVGLAGLFVTSWIWVITPLNDQARAATQAAQAAVLRAEALSGKVAEHDRELEQIGDVRAEVAALRVAVAANNSAIDAWRDDMRRDLERVLNRLDALHHRTRAATKPRGADATVTP